MKRNLLLLAAILVVLFACNKDDSDQPVINNNYIDSCTITTKLIANGPNYDSLCQGLHVGTVTVVDSVVDDSNFISVTYDIILEDWLLKLTQLYIGPEPDIPANGAGNPKLGQFPFIDTHDTGVTTFTIGPIYLPDSTYVIAAHAEAEKTISLATYDSICELLPTTVDFSSSGIGPDCYLNIDVINGGWLDGTYLGWCIDLNDFIGFNDLYKDADVYCTLDPLPDGLVDHPENIDLINWILNNDFLGNTSACGGIYTFGDIQKAIWDLIEDEIPGTALLGDWSQCRADEITADAKANGEGYQPEPGDILGVILDADNVQNVIIAVPWTGHISLGVNSAWGYGQNGEYCDPDGAPGISFTDSKYYGGSHWGWYFYGCE